MAPKAAHAAEKLETALDYSNVPPFWKRKNGLLLYFVLTSSFFSSLASGFDGVCYSCCKYYYQEQSS